MLQYGSVSKLIRTLLSASSAESKAAHNGISIIVNKQIKSILSDSETPFSVNNVCDPRQLHLDTLANEVKKKAPLLWTIFVAFVGKKKNNKKILSKLLAAFAILLNARSRKKKFFQVSIGVAMYDCELQKEGYNILNAIGVTVSYQCVMQTLNKVRLTGMNEVLSWKESLEMQLGSNILVEHDYCIATKDCQDRRIIDHDYAVPITDPPLQSLEPGYRLNLDNLDYYIRVRNMTEEHQNELRHYIQVMAVKDRINCEHLSNEAPVGDLQSLDNTAFIPNPGDICTLRKDMIQVVSYISCKCLSTMASFKDCTSDVFEHEYSAEMSKRSAVVIISLFLQKCSFSAPKRGYSLNNPHPPVENV